ncbi:MAG: hypothetical protein M3Y46_08970 [Actinomycetota bacterium]|nr:hypothetical protein [Actinomycetota bacterium]
MNIPRQMINLIGIVLVVGILVAGIALIALPPYGSAQAIDTDTRSVAQTNGLYEIRVTSLSVDAERIDEITADVTQLRLEIPASSHLDDVVQIAVDAAVETGVTIEGFEAAAPEAWAPRTGLGEDGQQAAPTDAPETTSDAGTTEGDAPAPEATADGTDPATTPPVEGTDAAASPQRQIPVTIRVAVPSAEAAAAFMDALGRGPRLLLPIDGTLDGPTLTVTALALVRTED